MKHWKRWLISGIGTLVVLATAGPYIYIHFIEGPAPKPLSIGSFNSPSSQPVSSGSTQTQGTWVVTGGSTVGYRVNEILFGQTNVAVGRTSSVQGSLTLAGSAITKASFSVDMTSVQSDQSRRDDQFQGRIMETATFPTATFTLTKPIPLTKLPAENVQGTYQATGKLVLHGVTKTITFSLQGVRRSGIVQVQGSIPIVFADYNIQNPSFGGIVTTDDHGILEFLINFKHA
ncbi:MAG: YceI family protein [Actinomycetota bacterium]